VARWRELIDHYFPSTGWLRLDHDTLRALARYRSSKGLMSWEATLEELLHQAGENVS